MVAQLPSPEAPPPVPGDNWCHCAPRRHCARPRRCAGHVWRLSFGNTPRARTTPLSRAAVAAHSACFHRNPFFVISTLCAAHCLITIEGEKRPSSHFPGSHNARRGASQVCSASREAGHREAGVAPPRAPRAPPFFRCPDPFFAQGLAPPQPNAACPAVPPRPARGFPARHPTSPRNHSNNRPHLFETMPRHNFQS